MFGKKTLGLVAMFGMALLSNEDMGGVQLETINGDNHISAPREHAGPQRSI